MLNSFRRIVQRRSPFIAQLIRKFRTPQTFHFIVLLRYPTIDARSSLKNNGFIYSLIKRCLASKDYPGHVVIKLPALSPTMEVGAIASWNKKEGDSVTEGEIIAEIETDKATIGVEADDPGFIAKILVPAGTVNVKVGTPIAIIVEKKEYIAAFKNYSENESTEKTISEAPKAPSSTPPKTDAPSTPALTSPPPTQENTTRKTSIDFSKGKKENTSVAKPVEPTKTAGGEKYTDHPVSSIRAVIAKRLLQAKQEIPHFYLSMDIETTQMENMRKVLNTELAPSGLKISVNDIIIKATALACKKVPEANSSWMGTHIRNYNSVDVSVAVSTPTGLITPIIFDADMKILRDISTEMKELAKKARQGKLKPKEFQGGTFTISNLGMMGIQHFLAIVNPPQTCILAIGSPVEILYMKESNITAIGVKKMMNVTLSCDHRVVDGAIGAQWLQAFKRFMEEPKTMF